MDERSKVDKYLCTVCGHRHSNGWYCKHSIDAKDATIAELRAEVERLKAVETILDPKRAADIAAVVKNCRELGWSDSLLAAALNRVTDANAELTQLREDRRVLGAEVRSWRYQCVQENTEGGDVDGATCMVNAAMEATDASGALGRAQ